MSASKVSPCSLSGNCAHYLPVLSPHIFLFFTPISDADGANEHMHKVVPPPIHVKGNQQE